MTFAPKVQADVLRGYDQTIGVAVGNGFVGGHRKDGMVQCQGTDEHGQIGGMHPEESSRLTPTMVLLGGVAI